MSDRLIVSASGIRGVVGGGFDAESARRYGVAYGSLLEASGSAVVLLGRDSRVSGRLLADAVAAGLIGTGWDVGDLGVVPTPTALLAVQDDGLACGGVVVTASHNPAEWNGLKLASADGLYLAPEAGRRVQALFESEGSAAGPGSGRWADRNAASAGSGRRRPVDGAIEHHLERILDLPFLSPGAIAERGLRVVVDAVRGTGGLILPRLLERLGCEVSGIHLEADGHFPRDPEPTAANLGELADLVRAEDADLGLAVDPDADRLAVVDEHGVPIGEDYTLALAVELVLARRPGPVVANLSSSQCIVDAAARAGQPVYLAPVGEANVARKMAEVGAVIGGEGNGGVMLPELHTTRDAPLAAALVVQLLAERSRSLSEIVGGWPRYEIAKRKVGRSEGPLDGLYETLERESRAGGIADRQDGLRLAWPDRREWLHVRPSGTEPIVRVIAEAPEAVEADALANRAVELVSD